MDVETFPNAQIRALWTFAEVDEFARQNPNEKAVGYLSVILTQLDIVAPYKRNMLMCNECCGMAVYANKVEEVCRGCENGVELRINPRIVSSLSNSTSKSIPWKRSVANVTTAWSGNRRNRTNRKWQTRPDRYCLGAVTWTHACAAGQYQPGDAEISRAEADAAARHYGICFESGGWAGEVGRVVYR